MWFDVYGHQTRQNTKKPQQNNFYCSTYSVRRYAGLLDSHALISRPLPA